MKPTRVRTLEFQLRLQKQYKSCILREEENLVGKGDKTVLEDKKCRDKRVAKIQAELDFVKAI